MTKEIEPLETLDVAVNGLRNILEIAITKKAKVLFFLLNSKVM